MLWILSMRYRLQESLHKAVSRLGEYMASLDKKARFYLYASPLLVVVFVYINMPPNKQANINATNKHNVYHKSIKKYISNNKMLSLVSKLSSKNKLKIQKLDIKNKKIAMRAEAKIENILNFVKQISSTLKIRTFSIREQNDKFYLDIEFTNQMVFLKSAREPIDKKVIEAFYKDDDKREYAPLAIVGGWVYLDGKWKQAGDKYNGYIIKKVYAKKILLLDEVTNKTKEKVIIK